MATASHEYELALRMAETLSPQERARLVRELLKETEVSTPRERVSIMELEGLGKEIWEGIDPVSYVRAERDSWDR